MDAFRSLTRDSLRARLDGPALRNLRIIQAALMLGPLIFFLVVLFMAARMEPAAPGEGGGDPGLAGVMLLVTLFVTLSAVGGYRLVPRLVLQPGRLTAALEGEQRLPDGRVVDDPAERLLLLYQTVAIIRLALLEGAALLGTVTLLLGVTTGSLEGNPVLWVAVLPLAIHLVVAAMTFPTPDRVAAFLEERVLRPLRDASGGL